MILKVSDFPSRRFETFFVIEYYSDFTSERFETFDIALFLYKFFKGQALNLMHTYAILASNWSMLLQYIHIQNHERKHMAENKQKLNLEQRLQQERDKLHRDIWKIVNDLRCSVDGWDFKYYVLGFMCYRFLSEKLTESINQGKHKAGEVDFDYINLSDADAESARNDIIQAQGIFIRPSELFVNVKKKAEQALQVGTSYDDLGLSDTLKAIFDHIENSELGKDQEKANFKGIFGDIDVTSSKLGPNVATRNQKLYQLLDNVNSFSLTINASKGLNHSIDTFGDAYEFLMSMYASSAGKSGGEFFTPQDVSELLARLATLGKTTVKNVYDPTCGSGSLLLQVGKVLGLDNIRQGFYGQEINLTSFNLCRINMYLHNVGFEYFDIACADTLTNPDAKLKTKVPFEVIVSNPPFSTKWEGADNASLLDDERFSPAGALAPKTKADLAFVMHSLAYLAPQGTAAIVCFPGVMYRGGNEKKIRKFLIDTNVIDCVIKLPANLFFGTSIETCIMVLKRNKSDKQTLFIDASREFIKVTNNNRLSKDNINTIVEAFAARQDKAHFVRSVPYEEIVAHDYNLTSSVYIEPEDTREKVDIVKLNAELKEIVASANALRQEIDKLIATIEVGV